MIKCNLAKYPETVEPSLIMKTYHQIMNSKNLKYHQKNYHQNKIEDIFILMKLPVSEVHKLKITYNQIQQEITLMNKIHQTLYKYNNLDQIE